jgi:hypothetical protein
MSVTCRQPERSTGANSPTTTPKPSEPPAPDQTAQKAILLADPRGIGYEVELPLSVVDPQTTIDAIYDETPFIPYLKHAGKPTTYDTVEAFVDDHPDGDSIRPILERHLEAAP